MSGEAASSVLLPAAIVLPILGAASVVPLSRVSVKARNVALPLFCTATLALVVLLDAGVLGGVDYHVRLMQITPTIWLDLRADGLGVGFASSIALLWLIAVVYSVGYMADEHRTNRYYSFLMLAMAWTVGLSLAGNLLTFLIFYELFSILTYPLVVHEETPEAVAAGTKYIIYILLGGGLVLVAIVFTYFLVGSGMLDTNGLLSLEQGRATLIGVFWCFIAGFGVKAALVPLHGWVPDAHPAAPAPFSALLSGVMVAAGSFGIARVIHNVFGADLLAELGVMRWLGFGAGFTVLFAAVLALSQDDLKRRLAYSTISQMGYVVLGMSFLRPEATIGALAHIAHHAFMKGALFLCAGLLIKRMGVRRVSEMGGAGKRMPLTMAAFTVASLGMIGTPPLSGFVSKWYLGLGMVAAGQPLYLVVLLAGALLAAGYLLPVVYAAYFGEPPTPTAPTSPGRLEAPAVMLMPLALATAVTLLLGVLSSLHGLPVSLARLFAERMLG